MNAEFVANFEFDDRIQDFTEREQPKSLAAFVKANVPHPREGMEAARKWVRDNLTNGEGMCLATVRGYYGIPMRDASAKIGWQNAQFKHRVTDDNYPDDAIGFPIWWSMGGTSGNGHVAEYAGNGECWSTDYFRGGGLVTKVKVADISRSRGAKSDGWTEDINGVRIVRIEKDEPLTDADKKWVEETARRIAKNESSKAARNHLVRLANWILRTFNSNGSAKTGDE